MEEDREEMDKGCGWPCQNLEFYVHQCIIFITIIKIVKMLSLCRKASSTGWKIEWSIPLQCAMLSGVGTSSCSSDSASTSACTGHNGRAGYSGRPGHCSRTGHNGGPGDSSRAGYSGRPGHSGTSGTVLW